MSQPTPQNPTRREFTRSVALAAATPLLLPAKTTAAQPAAAQQEPIPAVVDALTEIVRTRYGKHLTDEQLKLVRANIERSQRSADRLKQFKLKNGDEPCFMFSADVPGGK